MDAQSLAGAAAEQRRLHRAGAAAVYLLLWIFAAGGIETVAGAYLGITDGFRLAEPEPEAILDLALSAWDPRSDGLVAACLNFRAHPIIDALEARIGKPVVTSTQAVLWHLLRLAGVNTQIPGFGRLLREY